MQKIPFHIISGFLGSGKTTFLKKIIQEYSGRYNLGIIQNEFSSSDIDGKELQSSGDDFHLLKINKGSVFCVCLLGDFNRSLENFIDKCHPDILILETTGLSDTTSVAELVSGGTLGEKIYLATNWCIVDSYNFSRSGLMKQRVLHQIRMADVILINKTDLQKDDVGVTKQVGEINPFAEVKKTVYCNAPFEPGHPAVSKYYAFPAKPMGRPDINSMVIKSGKKTTIEQATDFLQQWAPKAYRIKGYINLKNGNTLAVQCVYDTVNVVEIPGSFYPTEITALTDNFTLRDWVQSFKSFS